LELGQLKSQAIQAARKDPVAWAAYCWRTKEGQQMILPPHARDIISFCRTHPRAVILIPPNHAKSVSLSQVLVSWALGLRPNDCWAVISKTHRLACRNTRAILSVIDRNPRVQEVFSGLIPGEELWSPSQAILGGRREGNPDPSLQALGIGGALAGTRLDGLVIDDPQDQNNSRTEQANDNVEEWVDAIALARLSPTAPCWVICTSFSDDDLAHRLIKRGWPTITLPAIVGENTPQEHSLWPERWPIEKLKQVREEIGPWNWSRVWQQNPMSDADSRFKKDWVDKALLAGSTQGLALRLDCPYGSMILCGVDPAVKKTAKSDLAAFVVVEIRSDHTRRILDVEAGKMDGPAIQAMIQTLHDRYRPIFYVEDVAAQSYLLQFAPKNIDVRAHHTSGQFPIEFEVEKLAAEFSRGMWSIPALPSGNPAHQNIDGLIRGMYKWRKGSHVDDRLAALCFVRSHAEDSFMKMRIIDNPVWKS